MNWHFWSALIFLMMVIVWGFAEFGWGGGDANSKDHNRPPWSMW